MSASRFLFLGIGAFAAIGGVFAIVIQHDTTIKAMTDEQREVYKAEERQREARKTQQKSEAAAARALQKAVCETVNVCKKYGTVRQDCAVAGNFKNCVQVKMNVSYATLETDCNDDGTPRWQPANVHTNAVACFFALNLP
jgi:hypothetical protein